MNIRISIICLLMAGCVSQQQSYYLPHRPRIQSWDQENLHNLSSVRNDRCEVNAAYDAPDGDLRFCL